MNANAYGGQLAEVLEWVEVTTAAGTERRDPELVRLRLPQLEPRAGRGRLPRLLRAHRRRPRWDPRHPGLDARPAREAQPAGIKTFGSTFKNPDDARAEGRSAGQLLEAAGCRGLVHGGARFSEKHANFVENMGEATTADVLALMAEGRRRVKEKFGIELEPEVQVLGDVVVPGWHERGRVSEIAGHDERERAKRERYAVRRALLAVAVLAVVAVAVYWFGLRGSSTPTAEAQADRSGRPDRRRQGCHPGRRRRRLLGPRRHPPDKKAASEAPGKHPVHLSVLSLKQPPKNGRRVGGHVLEQVHILAAAPRPCAGTSPRPVTARPGSRRRRTRGSKSASATTAKRRGSGKRPPPCWPIRP